MVWQRRRLALRRRTGEPLRECPRRLELSTHGSDAPDHPGDVLFAGHAATTCFAVDKFSDVHVQGQASPCTIAPNPDQGHGDQLVSLRRFECLDWTRAGEFVAIPFGPNGVVSKRVLGIQKGLIGDNPPQIAFFSTIRSTSVMTAAASRSTMS